MPKATGNNSTRAPSRPDHPNHDTPALDAATILARALDAASGRAIDLFDGLATLSAMGEAETVEIKGDALRWLADKFRADANEIMSDIDHAQFAGRGGVYEASAARYATPDDDPKFRNILWHATGGAAGEPAHTAEAEPETSRRHDVHAAAEGSAPIAPADPTWPGGLDLSELHRALAGVAGCLAGLDSLGDSGSVIEADYLGPPIETLITWKHRVQQAHDALEAATAGAGERPE